LSGSGASGGALSVSSAVSVAHKKTKTYNNKNLDRVKAREVVVLRDLF